MIEPVNLKPLLLAIALTISFLSRPATAYPATQADSLPVGLSKAARAVLYSIYTRDAGELSKWVIVDSDLEAIFPKKALTPNELKELESELATLSLRQVMPFSSDGHFIEPRRGFKLPIGAKTVYDTSFRGNLLAIPVVLGTSGWKVDIRFWIADAKRTVEHEKQGDPEVIARQFLLYTLGKRPDKLANLTAIKIDPEEYTSANNLPPGDLDQVISLCFEMPLIRARAGDRYRLPSGEIVRAGEEKDTIILVGLYGVIELAFQLKYVEGRWKIVPQHYYEMLRAMGAI